MEVHVLDNLAQIDADAWDAVSGRQSPFLRHAFLNALETSGCVAAKSGWQPQHIVLHDDGALVGAVPLYLKHHSYGEYIFDWAWANAYARASVAYYPKLTVAVPFTPVTGPRLLIHPRADRAQVAPTLIAAVEARAAATDASSIHWLFTSQTDNAALTAAGFMERLGYQFHWQNRDHRTFDDFLTQFTADKRKKIKRERRYVRDAGVTLEVRSGADIAEAHWHTFYEFYRATAQKHGAIAYLNLPFFLEIGRTMAEDVVLILARHADAYVAGALNFKSDTALYGRYWGSLASFHSLHFETCYYRALEYCLDTGLNRFEAGAQGEHKLSRGFLPTPIYSAHWLRHAQFSRAVADFLDREHNGMEYYMNELNEHSPFRKDCP